MTKNIFFYFTKKNFDNFEKTRQHIIILLILKFRDVILLIFRARGNMLLTLKTVDDV